MENQREIEILNQVLGQTLDLETAQNILQVSRSTVYRKIKRLRNFGSKGLEHGLRGRPSNARIAPSTRDAILKLHKDHATKFNSHFKFYCHFKNQFPEAICFATFLSWIDAFPKHRERRTFSVISGQNVLLLPLPLAQGLVSIDLATSNVLLLNADHPQNFHGIVDHLQILFQKHGICENLIIDKNIILTNETLKKLEAFGCRMGTSLLIDQRATSPHPFLSFWEKHFSPHQSPDGLVHAFNKCYATPIDKAHSLFVPLNGFDPIALLRTGNE